MLFLKQADYHEDAERKAGRTMLAAAAALLVIAAAGCTETRPPQESIPQAEGSGRKISVRLKSPSADTTATNAATTTSASLLPRNIPG